MILHTATGYLYFRDVHVVEYESVVGFRGWCIIDNRVLAGIGCYGRYIYQLMGRPGAMARVPIVEPEAVTDPVVEEIFAWVTEMEGSVPNHFYLELNFPEYMRAKLQSTAILWEEGELSMPEIQHVGIAVSTANGCAYCTGAFCTILDYGLDAETAYVREFAERGIEVLDDDRLEAIVEYALTVNDDPHAITDADIETLRDVGLGDRGIVQLTHLVSDFASYNRLNTALDTDYDYQEMWRTLEAVRTTPAGE